MANTLAYGFVGQDHLFAQRIEEAGVRAVDDFVAQSLAEHNRQVDELMGELAETTTEFKGSFTLPGGGTLQPLDEWGNPLPVREAGFFDVAWPIGGGGTAWGDNRVTRALMTVGEVNRHTVGALLRDADWMKRHLLAALFDNVAWVYVDKDTNKGSLTIQSLANGDTVTFLRKNGTLAVDNHYLAQAAAISDAANPYTIINDELAEHPGNNGPIVAYIPTNLKATTIALTNFQGVSDPDIATGADQSRLSGAMGAGFGDSVLGKMVDGPWIVEWSLLPNDYIVGVARGATAPPLRMREHPAASLQGLFRENHSPDGNLQEYRLIRYAGFGAYNRVAALVFRIGNASYAIPAGYDAPLAV